MNRWIATSALLLICGIPWAHRIEAQQPQEPNESKPAATAVLDIGSDRVIELKTERLEGTVLELTLHNEGASRAEDTEILRHLLKETLQGLYQWPATVVAAHPHWVPGQAKAADVKAPESVYLDDYGVVFQATAPPLRAEKPSPDKDQTEPVERLDTWERTRRELRGVRVASTGSLEKNECRKCHTDESVAGRATKSGLAFLHLGNFVPGQVHPAPTRKELTDALVTALAENGHRLRGLEADERVTLAVAFRQQAKNSGGGIATKLPDRIRAAGGNPQGESQRIAESLTAFARLNNEGGRLARLAIDISSPGDLHLRQGNYNKAVQEYVKALKQHVDGDPYEQNEIKNNRVTALYKKLIQAHVGGGQYDRAQKLLELIKRSKKDRQNVVLSLVMTAEREMPLPGRLLVSATKSQLDKVASGELSLKEFRKQATVRYTAPRPASAVRVEARSDDENKAKPRQRR